MPSKPQRGRRAVDYWGGAQERATAIRIFEQAPDLEAGDDPLRSTVAEIVKRHRVDRDVTRPAVPLERHGDPLRWCDFAKASLETMIALRGVLYEAPVTPTLNVQLLERICGSNGYKLSRYAVRSEMFCDVSCAIVP